MEFTYNYAERLTMKAADIMTAADRESDAGTVLDLVIEDIDNGTLDQARVKDLRDYCRSYYRQPVVRVTDRKTGSGYNVDPWLLPDGDPEAVLMGYLADIATYPGIDPVRCRYEVIQYGRVVLDLDQVMDRENLVFVPDRGELVHLLEPAYHVSMLGWTGEDRYTARAMTGDGDVIRVYWNIKKDWTGEWEEDACRWSVADDWE